MLVAAALAGAGFAAQALLSRRDNGILSTVMAAPGLQMVRTRAGPSLCARITRPAGGATRRLPVFIANGV